jgi:two-component system CheB/CheR fusion protein
VGPGRWRAVGVCTEITERKQLEDASVRLAAIVESSQDAILGQTLDGHITSWNRGAEEMYGYTAEEMLGKHVSLLLPPEMTDESPAMMERLRIGVTIASYETVRMRRDGSRLHVSLSVSPIRDGTGAVVGAAKIARDITARKSLEAELRQRVADLAEADRRKDEFLAMLAHELRNPLGAISNAVEALKHPDAEVADDLLDVSRLTRGLVSIRHEPLDIGSLVRDTGEDYRAAVEAVGMELDIQVPPERICIAGDSVRLAQILGNLLSNAIKFSAPGSRITLSARAGEGGSAIVSVRDTGEGIPAPLIPVIFDSFVQGDRTLARTRGGLGLGLAIVKGLVQLHGGTVWADSAGPGAGSEFSFSIPLSQEQLVSPPVEEPSLVSNGRVLRVLIVEDNADAAESLRDVLEMKGYEVELALNGLAALDTARHWKPDVVLCDIGLPGMDGYEVARAMREDAVLAPCRLVAVTGYGEEEHRRRAREAGFDRHVLKPIDLDALHRLIQTEFSDPA